MDGEARLKQLYVAYCAAQREGQRPGAPEASVEGLLRARVELFEHLVRTGWDAPQLVRQQIVLDRLLLDVSQEALSQVDRLVRLDRADGVATA